MDVTSRHLVGIASVVSDNADFKQLDLVEIVIEHRYILILKKSY